jgi:hypothetical protein
MSIKNLKTYVLNKGFTQGSDHYFIKYINNLLALEIDTITQKVVIYDVENENFLNEFIIKNTSQLEKIAKKYNGTINY